MDHTDVDHTDVRVEFNEAIGDAVATAMRQGLTLAEIAQDFAAQVDLLAPMEGRPSSSAPQPCGIDGCDCHVQYPLTCACGSVLHNADEALSHARYFNSEWHRSVSS